MECQEDVPFSMQCSYCHYFGGKQFNYVVIIVLVPNRHSGIIYLMLTLNNGIGIIFPEI